MQDALTELRQLTAHAGQQPSDTGIPGVTMIRGDIPAHQLAAIYEPMIGLTLQGRKTLTIGERLFSCDPSSYFVLSVDLPVTALVQPGPRGETYASVGLSLNRALLVSLLADLPPQPESPASASFCVCPTTPALLDAWLRLLRLMRTPADIPALAPAYEREILYRVLQGPQGRMLRALARPESTLAEMHRAITWMRQHLAQSFHVADLAHQAGMSESVFYRHFRAVTGLSPIQFHKQLRLLEARKTLASSTLPAARVALEVGYESVSQFNREYARFFGAPPARDAARMRQAFAPLSSSIC